MPTVADTPLRERLRLPISESMFVRKTDMLTELFRERAEAADLLDEMVEALESAQKLAEIASEFSGCRGDDDYVWGLEAKFEKLVAKATGGTHA